MSNKKNAVTDSIFLPNCNFRTHTIIRDDNIPHGHNYLEVFYILEGEIIHKFNGENTVLSVGDMWILEPNSPHHHFERIKNKSCTHRDIMFTALQYEKTLEFLQIATPVQKNYLKNMPVKLSYANIERFEQLIREIVLLPDDKVVKRDALISSLCADLLTVPLMQVETKAALESAPMWFNNFLALFNKADIIKGGVRELKKYTPFSYEHIGRIHKKLMGKTIVEHLTEVRIAYASDLLRTTDLSIINIAMDVGYNSLSHFNYIFKKYHGVSPNEYKIKMSRTPVQTEPS